MFFLASSYLSLAFKGLGQNIEILTAQFFFFTGENCFNSDTLQKYAEHMVRVNFVQWAESPFFIYCKARWQLLANGSTAVWEGAEFESGQMVLKKAKYWILSSGHTDLIKKHSKW